MHASHALYTSRCTGPTPRAHLCTRRESGFFSTPPQPWYTCDSRSRAGSCRACAPAFAALRVRTPTNPAGEPLLVEVRRPGELVYDLPAREELRVRRWGDLERLDPGVRRLLNLHGYHVSLTMGR